jgi:RNA polymerase sigma-32 factor
VKGVAIGHHSILGVHQIMANLDTAPTVSSKGGRSHFLEEIRKFPLLTADQEYLLAKRWRDHGDEEAAHKLVTSHLRLVAKIAMGYRGYGLPLSELISEGNVGMTQAVKRFDPDRGFRLATYAIWWIRAAIQEYVLHSWSLVKMGTTAAQKKLFFGLRKIKGRLNVIEDGDLPAETVETIARELAVPAADVVEMNRRLAGHDGSLDAPVNEDSEALWLDRLADECANPEVEVGAAEELRVRRDLLQCAIAGLRDRERYILTERRLSDPPKTLAELGQIYGVSRERVRQIEVCAFQKVSQGINAAIAGSGT